MKKQVLYFIMYLIIVAIVGTFIINEAYKIDCGYVTEWEARDMLMFFGTILGGISTLSAVYVTIKDGDKKRKKDRSDFENRERYKYLSRILFEALSNLDGSYLLDFKHDIDRRCKTLLGRNGLKGKALGKLLLPEKLSDLIEMANIHKNMEIYFPSDEKIIFNNTLTKFREYREEYISLLQTFKRQDNTPVDLIIDMYNIIDKDDFNKMDNIIIGDDFNKIESLCSVRYKELVDSVHESLKIFEQRQF